MDLDKAEIERDEHAAILTQRLQDLRQKFSDLQSTPLARALSDRDIAFSAAAEDKEAHEQLISRLRKYETQPNSRSWTELRVIQDKLDENEKLLAAMDGALTSAKNLSVQKQEALDAMEKEMKDQISSSNCRASAIQETLSRTEEELEKMVKAQISRDEESVGLRSQLVTMTQELELAHETKVVLEREKVL